MTVALLLAAAPDRLSAMAQPYRRPDDPMGGGGPRIGGMDGRLVAVGVRQIEVAMCADAADGLRAVAATVRAADDSVLVCASGPALATPTAALAMLLSGTGTTALTDRGALLVARDDLSAVADAADALAARIGAGERPGSGRKHHLSVRRMHRRTRIGGDLNSAVRSLIEDIDSRGVQVASLAGAAASPGRGPGSDRDAGRGPGSDRDAGRGPGSDRDAGLAASRPGEGAPGLVAALAVAPLASKIARWAAARSLTPNALTCAAFALAGCAAAWFAAGTSSDAIVGAALLCTALLLRHARTFLAAQEPAAGAFGSWLDSVTSMIAEYGVYAGLAVGWTTAGPRRAWAFATAAMVLLAVRQMADACYAEAAERRQAAEHRQAAGQSQHRPPGAGHRVLRLAGQSIALPPTERTVLIAVTAPVWGPRLALSVLLGWGAVAFGYSLAERVVASRVPAPLGDTGDGGERAARSGAR